MHNTICKEYDDCVPLHAGCFARATEDPLLGTDISFEEPYLKPAKPFGSDYPTRPCYSLLLRVSDRRLGAKHYQSVIYIGVVVASEHCVGVQTWLLLLLPASRYLHAVCSFLYLDDVPREARYLVS